MGKIYTEKQVNEIINNYTLFQDAAVIRREMYNLRLIERKKDCSEYWKE